MDAERWQRLSPLLDALLDLQPGARAEELERLRASDPPLAAELEALLAGVDQEAEFLHDPLPGIHPCSRQGSRLGPYRLERLLGEGGMGQVWLAERADGLYQRQLALKVSGDRNVTLFGALHTNGPAGIGNVNRFLLHG